MIRAALVFAVLYAIALLIPPPLADGNAPQVDVVRITLECPRAYKAECEVIAADARRQVELMLGPIGP